MRRAIILVAAAMLSVALLAPAATAQTSPSPSSPAPADRQTSTGTITLWEGTWNTVKINTEMASFILEEGYGYEAEQVGVSTSIMQQALLNGRIDVNLELWCINRQSYCSQHFGDGAPLTKLSPIFEGSKQGWYVPSFVTENNPGLRSVDDLPKYADLFSDPANPGEGRLLAGITGWAIVKDNRAKLHAYGLADTYNAQTVGSGAALDAAIVRAIRQRNPILAYNWTPRWIGGKFDLTRLEEPKWTRACADARDRAIEDGPPYSGVPAEAGCAFRTTAIHPGIRSDLQDRAPDAVAFLDRMDVGHDQIAQAAAYMKTEQVTPRAAALRYLREHPDRWRQWVTDDAATKVEQALASQQQGPDLTAIDYLTDFPERVIPLADWTGDAVTAFVNATGSVFGAISEAVTFTLARVQQFLVWLPWIVVVAAFAALAWAVGDWKLAAGVTVGFVLLGLLGVWEESMRTLALIGFAAAISVLIGVPLGVWAASNPRVDTVVRPILDFMQTMPAFVYLVPAVILFSIGGTPALFATVIYATPPAVRLTNHGIRQVPDDVVEAAEAFGSTPRQVLRKVQLPLAFPTIMAGINQTVMLALAMVVIASLVGAKGLGKPVLDGLQNLNVGLAFVGGLGIVILAMIIDRITQAAGGGGPEEAPA